MPDTAVDGPRIALATVEAAKAFIARFPSADAAVQRLLTDQRKARIKLRSSGSTNAPVDATIARMAADHTDEVRELELAIEQATERIPKDGQVVIPKADADELAEWRKIQLIAGTPAKPAEVAERVKKAGELEGTVAATEGEKVSRAAALALGWNADTLAALTRDKGVVLELRDETVDGKPVKVPYAKLASVKDAVAVKLTEFAEKELKPYIVALKAAESTSSALDSTAPHGGIDTLPQFPASGTAPSGGLADDFLRRRNEEAASRGNSLRPAKASTTK